MSRSLLRAVEASWILVAVLVPWMPAAEKSPSLGAGESRAKQAVQAALRSEAQGDNAQRAEQLQAAAAESPDLPEANWHSGRVLVEKKWLTLAEAELAAAQDSQREEYRQRRAKAGTSARLLRDLARWCMKVGLDDVARLHSAQLLSRSDIDDETRQEAIKRLQLKQVGGIWMTKDDAQAEEVRGRAMDEALGKWGGRVRKWQMAIDGAHDSSRDNAIKELAAVDDPHIITALEAMLPYSGDRFSEEAARLLTKFPQYEATQALVRYAALTPYVGAKEIAIAGLKQRPKHDYVPLLMSGLSAPIKTQYAINFSKGGAVQYSHAILQENSQQRVVHLSNQFVAPVVYRPRFGRYEPGTVPGGGSLAFVLDQVSTAEQTALQIELQASSANFQITDANRRVFETLERTTDETLPREPTAWWNWWQNYNEYYWPKPTYCAYGGQSSYYFAGTRLQSCFVAGTPVRSETGLIPIEKLLPGDRVLTQDQDTGELTYKIVLRTTLRPPTKMVRIKTGAEEIVTTLGHPFWVSGHGWKMAKELRAGDLLHSLAGAVPIKSVERLAREEPAHNLVVDDFNTYFVGQTGLLVHDNEFRKPTRATVPGLIPDVVDKAAK